MGTITGDNVWEDTIYQFEETDVVEGGPDGLDNTPLKELANRTVWLKNATGQLDDITLISSNTTLAKSDIFHKLVSIYANSASIACTLPALELEDKGVRVSIMAYAVTKQVSIISQGNDILFSTGVRQTLYMGDMESLQMVWTGDHWLITSFTGNLLDVGKPDYGYSQLPNTVVAQGQLLNRADYPRLWEYVQGVSGSLFDDFTWSNVAGYKGFFSTGNNATTFRIPDLRSMFIRGLDLGAAIDSGRNNVNAGGYEADDFKSHTHTLALSIGLSNYGTHSGNPDSERAYIRGTTPAIAATGGLETRPKNIGLIPLIKV